MTPAEQEQLIEKMCEEFFGRGWDKIDPDIVQPTKNRMALVLEAVRPAIRAEALEEAAAVAGKAIGAGKYEGKYEEGVIDGCSLAVIAIQDLIAEHICATYEAV